MALCSDGAIMSPDRERFLTGRASALGAGWRRAAMAVGGVDGGDGLLALLGGRIMAMDHNYIGP